MISLYAWFIFYMSKYSDVQASIKRELEENNISYSTPLTADLINNLTYVECVVKEVLRHANAIESVQRQVIHPDVIDGVSLCVGDQVLLPTRSILRNKDIWQHPAGPDAFAPERFLAKDKNHHPQALFAFGGGNRVCIGHHLAQFQFKVFVVRTMQRVSFYDAPGNDGAIVQNITSLPKKLVVYLVFDAD
jgi:cytochrome P450